MADSTEILLLAVSNIDLPAVKDEVAAIKEYLNQGFISLKQDLNVSYNSLDDILNDPIDARRITMLHYTGHSSDSGIIVEDKGEKKILGLTALNTLVQTHNRFRFVFLNSCYSEKIAEEFLNIGVPYVIGTTSRINDKDASIVAAKFYKYLSKTPKTIEESYRLTEEYFVQNPNKLNQPGEFRSSLVTGENKEKNIWKIYKTNLLTEEQKNWTLIPSYKFVLSNPINAEYKLKVLCLYEQKSARYYESLRIYFLDNKRKNWILHGIWDIFGNSQFEESEFNKELEAADIIMHLIESGTYLTTRFSGYDFEGKTNAVLPIDSINNEYFNENATWFAKSVIITSTDEGFGNNINQILFKFGIGKENPAPTIIYFKESIIQLFSKQLQENFIDPDLIKKDFSTIEFTEQKLFDINYADINQPILNFILLESSSECALAHLVRNIRKIAISVGNDNKYPPISFNIIGSESEFWQELHKCLQISIIPLTPEDYPNDCIRTILTLLTKEQNVCLIFRNINFEKIYLYENIKDKFYKVFSSRQDILNNLKTKLLFFLVNEEIQSLSKISVILSNSGMGIFRYSPIQPMKQSEIDKWMGVYKKKYLKLENTNIVLEDFDQKKGLRRKKFMAEICKELKMDSRNKAIVLDEGLLAYE